MTTVAEAHARIDRQPERAGTRTAAGIFAAVRKDNEVIVGLSMLVPLPASTGADRSDFEVGWHLHPDSWGRGFATEAARTLLDRGFAAGLKKIYAVTDRDNVRSQAVCRRLGITDLGLRSDWYDKQLRAFFKESRVSP